MAQKLPKTKTRKVTKNAHYKKVEGIKPTTLMRLQDVASQLSEGKSRATIIQYMQEKYDIAYDTAKDYYIDGVKYLLPADENEYRKELIQVNIERLEAIYERAMAEGDYKNAKDAISELNKMTGCGKEGITVGINTDKVNDSQQVFIKFDT